MTFKKFRKYGKKYAKKSAIAVRKRYIAKKGMPKIVQIARDLNYLRSQINAEHKHIDTLIGSAAGATFTAQTPTKDTPIILALNMPVRGQNNYNRIGNQIVITHITAKYDLVFKNNTDYITRNHVRARIVFAKDADDVPLIANLLEQDQNGHYTDSSFVNEQEYRKYIWLKSLDYKQAHRQMLAYDPTAYTGTPVASYRNFADYFGRRQWKGRIRSEYSTGTDDLTVNKPYLVLTSDIIESTVDYDAISVSATVRISYIDN